MRFRQCFEALTSLGEDPIALTGPGHNPLAVGDPDITFLARNQSGFLQEFNGQGYGRARSPHHVREKLGSDRKGV